MFFQSAEVDFFRDVLLILRFFAVFYLFFIVTQLFKKAKRGKIYSITYGFAIFVLSIGLFHLFATIEFYYPSEFHNPILYFSRLIILFIGMFSLMITCDIEYKSHFSEKINKFFPFPITFISIAGLILITYSIIIYNFHVILIFLFLCIPLATTGLRYVKKFTTLKIINQTKPIPWLLLGFGLIGFSCFFGSSFILSSLGAGFFVLSSILIVLGAIFLNRGWRRLPLLSELDWLSQMEKILIIELKTSSLLFQYSFGKINNSEIEAKTKETVAGSLIGGIDNVLKKVLECEGHMKSLEYGDKRIFFTHGVVSICILITKGFSNEFIYRLKIFHSIFEKEFQNQMGKNWQGNLNPFEKVKNLMFKHFLL